MSSGRVARPCRGASVDLSAPAGLSVDEAPDVWKLAAIASFSVLAVVLVGAALLIGVMLHRRKAHKRPLRGERDKILQTEM